MQRHESLGGAEFAPEIRYLNSASSGLLPLRAVTAVRAALDESLSYGSMGRDYFGPSAEARAAFARLLGVPADRVAIGSSVAVQSAFLAGTLPPGSEVLAPEGDFSSLVTPFAARPGITLRTVPLDELAAAVRPGTTLVAFSVVQSRDGRIADMDAVRDAARAVGARTYLDLTQAAGWLPMRVTDFDYAACGGYKWLLCPRGTAFMVFGGEHAEPWPDALHAGWAAGEDPGASCYGPVTELPATARRFDEAHANYSYAGAAQSLGLLGEIGVPAVHAHNTALAARYREGLLARGITPCPAPGSAIVSAPGIAGAADRLADAGVQVSVRDGLLRAAFHLYNSADDVDLLLDLLGSD
ncbi:aminotransferase class V-fold PLP-dependent enzyme [Streptomyces pinistramenti]|uniref:aminotransferase class V-fold PLP-dependent enzyme n=1 Tax=Streptomyces pinistramenti TaxID=2884812 RepID=UPI001D07BF77|nr:aminotransferase class V-fold PLP-dependent enzyme [Streptomyces pinistramenti]MCB5907285.1 aminotransferase class V-fold PLP-dependent enzyme [Streptomyces pinistramenti]